MEAKLRRHGDITVVHLAGKMDLEKSQYLRDVCLRELTNKKVVFCLEKLQFVGSSGIQTLFRAFGEMLEKAPGSGVKLAGVTTDFLRVLNYTAVSGVDVHETVAKAVSSFETGLPGFQETALPAVDSEEAAADEPERIS